MSPELAQKLRRSSVEVRSGRRGAGSGIIWSSGGEVITNAHVIGRHSPTVKLSDGREFPAQVRRQDPERDLALLQIDAQDLPAATIGDSSTLRVGQIVAAMGNPLGIPGAITTGIIHATGERRFIQADVRLAPGNSGGILADTEGRVIGVNTMIYAGLALAIPSNTAAAFASGESVDRPRLGITMQPIEFNGSPALVILEVALGSLADRHGLILGDTLLLSQDELRQALESGRAFLLRYHRGGELRQIQITRLQQEKKAA